jgi:hypothetical protein
LEGSLSFFGGLDVSRGWIIFFIILAILVGVTIVLYILGKRAQKKQAEQEEQIQAHKQSVNLLIIDKKRMPLKDAGLPKQVLDQAPKLARRTKVPVVKVKAGPQIMTLIADEKIYDDIPVKREVKAEVSGVYMVGVKGLHGAKVDPADRKKKSRYRRFVEKLQEKAGAKPVSKK